MKAKVRLLTVTVEVDPEVPYPESYYLARSVAHELVYPLGLFEAGTEEDGDTYKVSFHDGGWGHEGDSGTWKWEPEEEEGT